MNGREVSEKGRILLYFKERASKENENKGNIEDLEPHSVVNVIGESLAAGVLFLHPLLCNDWSLIQENQVLIRYFFTLETITVISLSKEVCKM